MYQSNPLPLFSWRQMQERIDAQFHKESTDFVNSLMEKSSNLDNAPVLLERAAQVRNMVPVKFMRLEQLLTISMQIETQLRREVERTAIADLQTQYLRLELLTQKALLPLASQPARSEDEADLLSALKLMKALENSGNGESIQDEKKRLRALIRPVRPIGQEDGIMYDQRYKVLCSLMSSLESNMTELYHSVKASLQFPGEMENILNEFNIPCSFVAPESVISSEPAELSAPDTAEADPIAAV